nr:zinc-ribbon and DUF3426 domain-containing protein [Halorhodospira halophila]
MNVGLRILQQRGKPVYTQCPGCGTIFALRAWQLRQARGRVTCGLCQTTFDAVQALSEELPGDEAGAADGGQPAASTSASSTEEAEVRIPALGPQMSAIGRLLPGDSDERPVDLRALVGEHPAAEQRAATASEETAGAGRGGAADADWEQVLAELRAEQRPARASAAGGPKKRRGRRWLVAAGVLVLAAALVHGSYLYRGALLELPGTRAWLSAVCTLYDCQLETAASYDVIEVEERWLEPDPRRDDALMLGGVLVHTGERRLPYPEMRLTLRDLDGHVTGERWVRPEDYVADSRLRARLGAGMEPGARVPVELYVAEPDGGAESFSLSFRPVE